MKKLVGSEYEIRNNFITEFSHIGKTYVVYYYKGKICVFDAKCPHARGDLRTASYENEYIVCPSHGLKFSLKTGDVDVSDIKDDFRKSIMAKGLESLKLFLLPTEIDNGYVYVELD
jgi:nitrite reductase/ring-hydroxylating ferredoxin subunit